MRSIILKQKQERDDLLTRSYINRDIKYDTEELLSSQLIKLISGPRRVGKSVFALLLLKDTNFAYLNFDDKLLLDAWDEDIVMSTLNEIFPNYKYLMLDEVQNLPDWDLWIAKLYRRNINLVITGSNAKMLSSEMATVLTGRYIQIEMLPFSLKETLRLHNLEIGNIPDERKSDFYAFVEEYLHRGGFPEVISSYHIAHNYLSTLFDSILLKDIAQRHNIRKTSLLYNLATYQLSNFCNPFTANSLSEELGISSVTTTKKFCDYLLEPYLFFYLPRFNNKLKIMQKAAQKVYVVDNGFVYSAAFNISENLGRLLENLVFVDLLRKGYECGKTLFYYRSHNDREVDFVTRRGSIVEQLIQVCYDLASPKTRKREFDALVECSQELNCDRLLVITNKEEETITYKGKVIEIKPFYSI